MLLTPPLFQPNFGGVPVAPDRPCSASTSAWALSYLVVKLFSKNSNLCDHGTWSLRTDGRTTCNLITVKISYCWEAANCTTLSGIAGRAIIALLHAEDGFFRTRLGDRSFLVAGPRLWNSLPAELRQPDVEIGQFRVTASEDVSVWARLRRIAIFLFIGALEAYLLKYLLTYVQIWMVFGCSDFRVWL